MFVSAAPSGNKALGGQSPDALTSESVGKATRDWTLLTVLGANHAVISPVFPKSRIETGQVQSISVHCSRKHTDIAQCLLRSKA